MPTPTAPPPSTFGIKDPEALQLAVKVYGGTLPSLVVPIESALVQESSPAGRGTPLPRRTPAPPAPCL